MAENRPVHDDGEYIPRSKRLQNNHDFVDLAGFGKDVLDEFYDYNTDDEMQGSLEQKYEPYNVESSIPERKAKKTASAVPAAKQVSRKKEKASNSVPVKKKKKKKKGGVLKKLLISVACILLSLVLIFVGAAYFMLGDVTYVDTDTNWEDSLGSNAPNWALADKWTVKNILILGIDSDGESGSRSDTMMILSIDRLHRQIKLTSLLRDLYVTVPGHGQTRLNHAYSYGGEALLMQTIECNFRIKIDEFVSVNFASFEEIVTAVGGVTIELSTSEAAYINKYVPGSLRAGEQRLNGAQAVFYSRIRALDSDFSRTGRQRTLLEALMRECRNMKITDLLGMIGDIAPNLRTNISRLELSFTGLEGILCWSKEIEEFSIPVSGGYSSQTIKGMSVLVPDMNKNCTLLHEFVYGKAPTGQ